MITKKEAAIAELVTLTRQAGKPVASDALPFTLYNSLLHHFGGIARARRAARLPDPPPGPRKWTTASVISELRRLHQTGLTIRFRDLERCGREDLVGAIRAHVGSIVRARVLAGIPHPPRALSFQEHWDEDRVVEEILELHERGQPLAYSKAPNKLVNAGVRYFESWDEALVAAGLDPDAIRLRRKPYDDAQLRARIRDLSRAQPAMTRGELSAHPDGQVLWRRYGSMETGLAAVGLTDWPQRVLRAASSEREVVAALRKRRREGKSLRKEALEKDPRLQLGITRRFGSISAALVAAGLDDELPDTTRWTRDEIERVLQDRRDRGLRLDTTAIRDAHGGLYPAAIREYGSYMAIARRFGAKPRQTTWTDDSARAALQRLARKHGVLKVTQVPTGLLRAGYRFWGTWEQICDATGVEHLDHQPRGHWTRDRIVDTLCARLHDGEQVTATALGSAISSAVWRQFGGLESALRVARAAMHPQAPRK